MCEIDHFFARSVNPDLTFKHRFEPVNQNGKAGGWTSYIRDIRGNVCKRIRG